jgi:5-methylcytosine-specific restriction enzyme B
MENFTWIPFYKELAQKLLAYKDRQNELIDFLLQLKNMGLPATTVSDKDQAGNNILLDEIDPFTFFASFNKGLTDANRFAILREIKKKFDVQSKVPDDLKGIPTIFNTVSRFFPHKFERDKNDIPMLWNLVEQAINPPYQLFESTFKWCLKIKSVAIPSLTIGLYWIKPDQFAACDSRMKQYLEKLGFDFPQIKNLKDYNGYLKRLKEFLPSKSFAEISFDAWNATSALKNTSETTYLLPDKHYWLYAPGVSAEMWEEFCKKGLMGIEWDVLGDLSKYPDKKIDCRKTSTNF